MAFSYSEDLSDDLSRVRFEAGDTKADRALFSDAEVLAVLANEAGDVLAAAAALCDQLATRFARDYDVDVDGQGMKRSQRSKAYEARAKDLRARTPRGGNGLGVVQVERAERA